MSRNKHNPARLPTITTTQPTAQVEEIVAPPTVIEEQPQITTTESELGVEWVTVSVPIYRGDVSGFMPNRIDGRLISRTIKESAKRISVGLEKSSTILSNGKQCSGCYQDVITYIFEQVSNG